MYWTRLLSRHVTGHTTVDSVHTTHMHMPAAFTYPHQQFTVHLLPIRSGMCACTLPMVNCQAFPVAIEAKEAAAWALGLISATRAEGISELCAAGKLATLARVCPLRRVMAYTQLE
jgi:hypothetical protein